MSNPGKASSQTTLLSTPVVLQKFLPEEVERFPPDVELGRDVLNRADAAHVEPHPRRGQRVQARSGRRRVGQVDEVAAAGKDVVLEVRLAHLGGLCNEIRNFKLWPVL